MNRKWLERESHAWVEEGIISETQQERIINRYSVNAPGKLLPYLGGVAIGLGILTAIAANWYGLAIIIRLIVIAAVTLGFQIAGEWHYRKGNDALSTVCNGLGIISFGAGLLLIHDMFTMFANVSLILMVWAVAAAFSALWYRQPYLYIVFMAISVGTQFYFVASTNDFNYINFALFICVSVYSVVAIRRRFHALLFVIAVLIEAWLLLANVQASNYWVLFPPLLLYVVGDILPKRTWLTPLQVITQMIAFVWSLIFVTLSSLYVPKQSWENEISIYLPLLAVILVVSLVGKWRTGTAHSVVEWILFLPLFLLFSWFWEDAIQADDSLVFIYVIAMYIYSLYVLWRGFTDRSSVRINLAVWLFLGSSIFAFINLNWNFTTKSILFLIIGIGLLIANIYIQRRKNKLLKQ